MAAKTLHECIDQALCVGPLTELKARLVNQLRDYFAHEVMRYQADMLTVPGPTGLIRSDGAQDLFNRVFKDVPAFPNVKKTIATLFILLSLVGVSSKSMAEDCVEVADAVKTLSNGSDVAFTKAFNECLDRDTAARIKAEDEAASQNRPIIIENHIEKPTKCVSRPWGDSIETVCE